MLMIIGVIVLILVVAVAALAASKPDMLVIQRTVSIKAPAAKIAPFIADMKAWSQWSPFERMDPSMKKTYTGPASGVGTGMGWEGKKVGKGHMELVAQTLPHKIDMALNFEKPMKAKNTVTFTLVEQGDTTNVTWYMQGCNSVMGKVMGVFCDMDHMIGKDFAAGLNNLKEIVEK